MELAKKMHQSFDAGNRSKAEHPRPAVIDSLAEFKPAVAHLRIFLGIAWQLEQGDVVPKILAAWIAVFFEPIRVDQPRRFVTRLIENGFDEQGVFVLVITGLHGHWSVLRLRRC